MTFTAIITSFNAADKVKTSLTSILAQKLQVDEIIIIDDHSMLEQYEQVANYKLLDQRIRVIRLKKNSGSPSHPRNIGMRLATGEYICFLDAGDQWLPDKLEKQNQLLRLGFDAVCSSYYVKKRGSNRSLEVKPPELINQKLLFKKCYVGSPTGIIKRKLNYRFKKIAHEDYEFWLNVSKSHDIAVYNAKPLAIYYREKGSRSSSLLKNIYFVFGVYRITSPNNAILLTVQYTFRGFLTRVKELLI